MLKTNSVVDYSAAMQSIRAEVEAYCSANGIDPEEYLKNLDGNLTAGVFDNATFDAYFQLSYMQLMEILYPEVLNSFEAQIGAPPSFDSMYEHADDDVNELIKGLIQDDPELMSYFTRKRSGQSEENAVTTLLQALYESGGTGTGQEDRSFTEDAQALADKYKIGDFFQSVIDQEESFKAGEMSILDRLSQYDSMVTDLMDQFNSGELTEKEYDAQLQEVYYGRESLMSLLQAVTEAESTYFEMISKIYDKAFNTEESIINKWA